MNIQRYDRSPSTLPPPPSSSSISLSTSSGSTSSYSSSKSASSTSSSLSMSSSPYSPSAPEAYSRGSGAPIGSRPEGPSSPGSPRPGDLLEDRALAPSSAIAARRVPPRRLIRAGSERNDNRVAQMVLSVQVVLSRDFRG